MDEQLTITGAIAPQEGEKMLPMQACIEAINTLAAQVAVAEARALQAGQQAWQLGVRLGHALCCLKAECEHGEFKKLFKNNSKSDTRVAFELTQRSAQRYMSLYKDAAAWCKRRSLSMCGGVLPAEADIPAELSMRGAMQLFRDEPEAPTRPTPTFTAPNKEGRIRKAECTLSEQQRVDTLARAATEELRDLSRHLDEFILAGRHTLAEKEAREIASNVLTRALRKLRGVN